MFPLQETHVVNFGGGRTDISERGDICREAVIFVNLFVGFDFFSEREILLVEELELVFICNEFRKLVAFFGMGLIFND